LSSMEKEMNKQDDWDSLFHDTVKQCREKFSTFSSSDQELIEEIEKRMEEGLLLCNRHLTFLENARRRPGNPPQRKRWQPRRRQRRRLLSGRRWQPRRRQRRRLLSGRSPPKPLMTPLRYLPERPHALHCGQPRGRWQCRVPDSGRAVSPGINQPQPARGAERSGVSEGSPGSPFREAESLRGVG